MSKFDFSFRSQHEFYIHQWVQMYCKLCFGHFFPFFFHSSVSIVNDPFNHLKRGENWIKCINPRYEKVQEISFVRVSFSNHCKFVIFTTDDSVSAWLTQLEQIFPIFYTNSWCVCMCSLWQNSENERRKLNRFYNRQHCFEFRTKEPGTAGRHSPFPLHYWAFGASKALTMY